MIIDTKILRAAIQTCYADLATRTDKSYGDDVSGAVDALNEQQAQQLKEQAIVDAVESLAYLYI